MNLEALREYAQAVYAASDGYLATLRDDALSRMRDLSSFGFGQQTMGWLLSNMILGHVSNHCGEISCLKGLQWMQGYPPDAESDREEIAHYKQYRVSYFWCCERRTSIRSG